MLILDQISLTLDARQVLQHISATAQVGSMTAVLGPNGAGKSSLLSVIAGERSPNNGCCTFAAKTMTQALPSDLARFRALLPQSSTLVFDFLVRDVVRLGGTPFPEISQRDLEALVDSVLKLTDSHAMQSRRYLHLSGGEKQRVQIARVLLQACAGAASGPTLLLLDEPTASLDPYHQHTLLAGLRELTRKLPLTVVASLHDVNLAIAYADQAWLLSAGQLIAADTPQAALTPARLSSVFQLAVRQLDDQLIFGINNQPCRETAR